MGSRIKDMVELMSRADTLRKELIGSIYDAVQSDPLEEVTVLSTKPHAVSIKLSTVLSTPGMVLSTEYYVPELQAEAIRRKLDACHDVTSLCTAVKEMLETKKVRFSHNFRDDAVLLNAKSLEILRDSEIGQYVIT